MKNTIKIYFYLLFLFAINSCSPFGNSHVNFFSLPRGIEIFDQGNTTTLKQTNIISWNLIGINESINVHHYEVSLGTSPGSTDAAGWVNVGLARSYTFTQTLDPETTYFANVRYIDKITFEPNIVYSSAGFQTPTNVGEIIASYDEHTCVINRQGKVKCWGYNSNGQLGYDDTATRGQTTASMSSLPYVDLGSGRTAKSIAVGADHTCVILDNNQVKCWGGNSYGQLGYDNSTSLGNSAGEMASLGYVNLGPGRTAKSIMAGEEHTCAILDTDQLKCWGQNGYGQLGYDNSSSLGNSAGEMAALSYVNLGAGRTAKAVAGGDDHTCVILDNNQVKCWGGNIRGQLGYDDFTQRGDDPGEMAALGYVNLGVGRTAKKIVISDDQTCAILDNDQVKCWGDNSMGQLGYDDSAFRGDNAGEMAALGYVNLGVGRTAKNVAMGTDHTCAILDNDRVKCWGRGWSGELGNDSTAILGDNAGEMAALANINLGDGRTAKSITAGTYSTCAILDNDQIKCWGYNSYGYLGYGNTATVGAVKSMPYLEFNDLGASRTVKKISSSYSHTCAILDNDEVKCWGDNASGQLGYDDTTDRGDNAGEMAALGYVNLGAGRTAKSISLGGSHTCAILDNDEVKCWGENANGQLGYDDTTDRGDNAGEMAALGYVNLGAGRTAKHVMSGANHNCAILDNDELKCWGSNSDGQLGYDNTTQRGDNPGEMAALGYVNLGIGRTAKSISLSYSNTCAILDNNEVKCWGDNDYGQLGYDNTTQIGDSPGEMAALGYVNLGLGRTAKSISIGYQNSCAILDNDELKCWGVNWYGQLGYDDTSHRGDSAGEMAALSYVNLGIGRTAKSISSSGGRTCAILDNNNLKCWGNNSNGNLGYDDTSNRGDSAGEMAALSYVNLGIGRTALSLAEAKSGYTCVILDNLRTKCWGDNYSGQLGYDNTSHYGSGKSILDALTHLYVP